jgi:hypothetical protein
MNQTLPHAIADQDFAAHYEQLRNLALGRGSGGNVGLTLLLRQGMAAWMQTCSCGTPPPARDSIPSGNVFNPLPDGVRSQAALILAGIVLNYPRETTPCQPNFRR